MRLWHVVEIAATPVSFQITESRERPIAWSKPVNSTASSSAREIDAERHIALLAAQGYAPAAWTEPPACRALARIATWPSSTRTS